MPEIRVFDPDLFRREAQRIAGADGPDDDFGFFANDAEGLRAKYLSALANDARQGARDLLIPTAATVTRLLSVEADHPNFLTAAGVYIRAARLSALSHAPLVIPPLLLVGPPVAADNIIWIAAANDASALQRSILDRFLVVPVAAPEKDAGVAITKRIYRAATEQYRAVLSQDLDDELAQALADATPRRLRLVFQIAAGFAAADGRPNLSSSDIENARRLLAAEERKAIGFLNL